MHVQLITRAPSAHPAFQRHPELPPTRVKWLQSSTTHRRVRRAGLTRTAAETYAKVGMLCGVLEGLSNFPIDGEVVVSVTRGSCDVSGRVNVFDPAHEQGVFQTLVQAERVARDLQSDPALRSVTVTYSQDIKELHGGSDVG